ncbi:MAG: DoxX family protein [Bacteroidota bacterium]
MGVSIYWLSTTVLSGLLLLSSFTYFFSESTIDGLKDLGFPDFFRIQLGVLKIIAAVVLLIPNIPTYVKDWAYAGVGLFIITAIVAHIAHRDSMMITLFLLVLFGVLAVSRYYL